MIWTFTTTKSPFKISAQQFDNPRDAANAAAEWLYVNAINDYIVAVELVSFKDDESYRTAVLA